MNRPLLVSAAVALVVCLSPARALHREDIPVLTRLAHDLEQRAAHVHRAAEQQAHHFTGREARMLRSLHHFHAQAGQFHRGLHTYFTSPAQVDAALEHLNEDAGRVERFIYRSHAVSHVVGDWNRCALLLRQINGYFSGGGHAAHDAGDDHHRW